MKRVSWLMAGISLLLSLLLSVVLISCGGYVKKVEVEKQLSSQKMDLVQRIQLAQDAATTADDKATKALAATKDLDKMKEEILSSADEKIDSALATTKGPSDEQIRRIAQDAASKALTEANSYAMAEDEKVKRLAKESAEKAMNIALEADRKAQEAGREAELAKELPKPVAIAVYTVYFDSGKAEIKTEYIAELEKAAVAIKEAPEAVVRIEGHADNTPVVYSKYGSNWALSQARANVVKDYLVDKLGVPVASIKGAIGFAEYKPIASNDVSNRWQNRRAEVIITH
jgi:flagellar motor protein MotB